MDNFTALDKQALWSPIPIPQGVPVFDSIHSRPATKLRLFVQTYKSSVPQRDAEISYCLQQNEKLAERLGFLEIVKLPAPDRLTFSQFFDAANAMNPDDDTVSIFANSDIRFDHTIRLARWMRQEDAWCLSRWRTESFIPDGHNPNLTPGYAIGADVWCVRGKVKQVEANFGMGMSYCDYSIAGLFQKAGYVLQNPCWSVRTWHHHESNYRTYDRTARTPEPWVYMINPSSFQCTIDSNPPTARASLTSENVSSLLQAVITRERVDTATRIKRVAACASCDLLLQDDKGPYCGVPVAQGGCGCGVIKAPVYFGIKVRGADLTLWSEEQGPLCHHPKREEGKGWPK